MESPTSDVLILVGDVFAAFAEQRWVRTVSQFTADLEAGVYHRYANPLHLVRGQGIDDLTWDRLAAKLALVPPGVLTAYLDPGVTPVCREQVHKNSRSCELVSNKTAPAIRSPPASMFKRSRAR